MTQKPLTVKLEDRDFEHVQKLAEIQGIKPHAWLQRVVRTAIEVELGLRQDVMELREHELQVEQKRNDLIDKAHAQRAVHNERSPLKQAVSLLQTKGEVAAQEYVRSLEPHVRENIRSQTGKDPDLTRQLFGAPAAHRPGRE